MFQSKKNLHSKHPSKGSQTQFSCFGLLSALANPADSCFFLCRYFVATSISSLRTEWRNLRSNSLSNASSPTIFYSECIDTLAKVSDAELNSWAIYDKLLAIESSPPLLPRQWAQMIGPGFSIDRHWSRVRDAFTENYKNDNLWLITLRGTKHYYYIILVSMDVSSLYTNIPQEEGTEIVCKAYDSFHNYNPPIPTLFLREMLGLILNENSFQFNGENYLQTHGTAMGTKMAVSFANIFMAKIETTLIQQSETKPKEWRRYIDDIFSLWDSHEKDVDQFIEQANKFHPTIKFTAEISENEITFLDTVVFKGERFKKESILDIKTHYKPTETFQYTHFNSCHPPGVKNGFIKGEAMRLLRTNSSKTSFEESLVKFKQHLRIRGYPKTVIERSLSGVNFADRPSALTQSKEKG